MNGTKKPTLADELRERGPECNRQGTMQETYAGPWIVSHEGSAVIKRELRFVEDDAPAGWQLLDGDYSGIAAALEAKDNALRSYIDEHGRAEAVSTGMLDGCKCAICKAARAALAAGQEAQ